MAKKYSSVRPKITSPFAQEKQKSTASNRIFAGNCAYRFCGKYFLGNPKKRSSGCHGWRLTIGS